MPCSNKLLVKKSLELAELPSKYYTYIFAKSDDEFMRFMSLMPRVFTTADEAKAALVVLQAIKVRYSRPASDNFWFVDAPAILRETRKQFDVDNNIEECLHDTKLLVLSRFDYVDTKDLAVLANVLHARRNRGRVTVVVTNGVSHNDTISDALMGAIEL